MRVNTQSGNVVSSHSSACGASSLTAKLVIDSRSASCSSVKMKCLRVLWKSGFSTLSAVAAIGVVSLSVGTAPADLADRLAPQKEQAQRRG